MNPELFKHTSRPVRDWPPAIDGYVHLLNCRVCVGDTVHEVAHFVSNEHAAEVIDLISPHLQEVQQRLAAGEDLGKIIHSLRTLRR